MAPRVTVVGSGPAGTLAAIALARCGIPVGVYEAYADPAGTTGSFVSLGANGLRVLRSLGCDGQVLADGFPVSQLHVWTPRGRLLGTVPGRSSRADFTSVTILRADLVAALRAEAVRSGATIHTGRWLVGAAPTARGVSALFTDGSRAQADVLVGADGPASRLRRAIDPGAPGAEYGGGYAVEGVARLPGIPPGALHVVVGPGSCLVYVASPADTIWWSAAVPAHDGPGSGAAEPDWRRRLTELYGDGGTVAGALIAATETLGRPVPLQRPHQVTRWRRGRMVVIGDAAHPIGYGIGAALAMEDGVMLARCVRDVRDLSTALAAYEALRRPRIDRVIRMAELCAGRRLGPVGRWLAATAAPLFLRHGWEWSTSWLLAYDVQWQRPVGTAADPPRRGTRRSTAA